MAYNPGRIAETYQLALETGQQEQPERGVSGFELEWNLLDQDLRPLTTVGTGPGRQGFVDFLRACCIPEWIRHHSQLEVFQWMIEWATRPYYHPKGAVYEGRLMEAVLINALHRVGRDYGQRLYGWHGNLLYLTKVGHHSIPDTWHVAKRRYLERCVDLYGESLSTAGIHTNLSLPESMLAWDFMHQPASERGNGQLEAYKNQVYITSARLLRAFAALFIATNASTPLDARTRDGDPVVVLTPYNSWRSLTFPNPPELDLPDLYRSHGEYLRQSYDLVRRGVRFGNNNWTPVRARSFAEPVEHLIQITSDQIEALNARRLYALGDSASVGSFVQEIEVENLLARINLPMSRVEVRTDDGGHPLEVDVANLVFKQLLLLRLYADPSFGRAFRYDREDIDRARRNEALAAREGLSAEIENPFTGKPVAMRDFLRWTLDELQPLAVALEVGDLLEPVREMAAGGPNSAERLRRRIRSELGESVIVPPDLLKELAEEREIQVQRDLETIVAELGTLGAEAGRLGEYLHRARDDVRAEPQAVIRFQPETRQLIEVAYPDKTAEVLDLTRQLVRIPSVSVGNRVRFDEIRRAGTFIFDYLNLRGLEVRFLDQEQYPAVLAGFPGQLQAPVMLAGHFDVVAPEPDDGQFEPRVEGDYLWGRGAADMKAVVATYLVWMKGLLAQGPPYPPVNLLLVANEERGEGEPLGTPFVLHKLAAESGYQPGIVIAGERTGERGDELWGMICPENRGVMRFEVVGKGARGHSAMTSSSQDLNERLFQAQLGLREILHRRLTLESPDGWRSQFRFPYVQAGTPGIYNITADHGVLGVEVRPIPQDDLQALERDRDGMQVEWGQLQLEQSVWATHDRIQEIARERLDLYTPPAETVVLVIK